MREFANLDEFEKAVGEHLGFSDWLTVTQERVNQFADATDDHQWIHVDAEKAAAGPFGTTIAHGYLTLSLLSAFGPQIYRVSGISMGINYGLNKVRFPQPVKVGAKIRAGSELVELTDIPGGKQALTRWTIEIDGEAKPALVAEWVTRFLA